MKKIDGSFRPFGLITLFLLYAILQTSHAIVMLSNRLTVSKIIKTEKVLGAENPYSLVNLK